METIIISVMISIGLLLLLSNFVFTLNITLPQSQDLAEQNWGELEIKLDRFIIL